MAHRQSGRRPGHRGCDRAGWDRRPPKCRNLPGHRPHDRSGTVDRPGMRRPQPARNQPSRRAERVIHG
jgi:hypothetical protein